MFKRIIKEAIPFVIIIAVVLFIKNFIVMPVQVKGDSMYPTLKDGDLMFLNKIGYSFGSINRFDIVVIDKGDTYIIKRVIGLPNETIKYEDNVLYINGEVVEEPHLPEGTMTEDFYYIIPEDNYFVMGDNRKNSLDSRGLGCFESSQIRGKTSLTFFPFSRFGFKN